MNYTLCMCNCVFVEVDVCVWSNTYLNYSPLRNFHFDLNFYFFELVIRHILQPKHCFFHFCSYFLSWLVNFFFKYRKVKMTYTNPSQVAMTSLDQYPLYCNNFSTGWRKKILLLCTISPHLYFGSCSEDLSHLWLANY